MGFVDNNKYIDYHQPYSCPVCLFQKGSLTLGLCLLEVMKGLPRPESLSEASGLHAPGHITLVYWSCVELL